MDPDLVAGMSMSYCHPEESRWIGTTKDLLSIEIPAVGGSASGGLRLIPFAQDDIRVAVFKFCAAMPPSIPSVF
jgi:hypothetical protein